MTKLESLQDIKDTAIKLQGTPMGSDMEAINMAEEAFRQLVDRSYQENEEMMAPQQYEAAKKDFEYFIRLVDLAMAYYRDRAKEEKGAVLDQTNFKYKYALQLI